ncbi:uncharacterized protein HMPREF1541_06589 [Cyphellophora europaea CBS 101466]|uniref:CENP-V/GFA domain-containing protein n=1 Tax=Cyphellophora europaea (strain CBS 101466) TaxID=1220924 RepID=W2RS43_CYPE1|nr:uncharacterized protein HMPREF1541_06589 [Cyphellophora europaea CBS 101466]ETN38553.1 hypothetical protein HMPREF1541_06589 [Cyphellophora europaea CBS 101466]
MASPLLTSEARLNCLCGAITLPGTYLLSSTFPVSTITCHCNPCRQVTGGLLPIFAWLNAVPPSAVIASTTAYHFTDRCTRYFCSTCGCVCLVELPKVGKWACTAGIIEPPVGVTDVVAISSHGYISDTIDGGLVPLLMAPKHVPLPLISVGHSNNGISPEDVLHLTKASLTHPLPALGHQLPASCHCGGVVLLISRANNTNTSTGEQPCPTTSNPSKHSASFCACRTCRLATGMLLQGWTHVSRNTIESAATGAPLALTLSADAPDPDQTDTQSNIRRFQISNDTYLSFCGHCGATISISGHKAGVAAAEYNNEQIRISVGILRAASGSMAREWLAWANDGEVEWLEELPDQSIRDCVQRGWGPLGLGRQQQDIA